MSRPRKGKPTCHPQEQYCARGLCHSCYHAWWDREHPDQKRETRRRYAEKYPERVRRSQRQLAESNPEKARAARETVRRRGYISGAFADYLEERERVIEESGGYGYDWRDPFAEIK